MCDTVIQLMVPKTCNIRGKHIHNINRGNAAEFAVDYRTSEHIACNCVDNVLFLSTRPTDIIRQHRNSADILVVNLLGQKIAMNIVGVQYSKFSQVWHLNTPLPI